MTASESTFSVQLTSFFCVTGLKKKKKKKFNQNFSKQLRGSSCEKQRLVVYIVLFWLGGKKSVISFFFSQNMPKDIGMPRENVSNQKRFRLDIKKKFLQ